MRENGSGNGSLRRERGQRQNRVIFRGTSPLHPLKENQLASHTQVQMHHKYFQRPISNFPLPTADSNFCFDLTMPVRVSWERSCISHKPS